MSAGVPHDTLTDELRELLPPPTFEAVMAELARVSREHEAMKAQRDQRWKEVQAACERAEMAYRERDEALREHETMRDALLASDHVQAAQAAEARGASPCGCDICSLLAGSRAATPGDDA